MLNLEIHEIPIFNICLFIRVCAWCLNLDNKICKRKKKKTVLLKKLLIQIQEWAVYYMGEGIKNGSILQYSKQYAVSKKMTPLFVKIDHMNQNFTDLHYVYYCLPLYCIPTA